MDLVFTRFVRERDPARFSEPEALFAKLRNTLVHELRKRSLFYATPRRLGVYGTSSWSEGDAVDELTHECYLFVFGSRLQGLKALAEVRDNVEGVVFRSIRNFLHESQKKHDPIGYRVFVKLRRAVRQAVDAGRLHVVAGDPGVVAGTVLGFVPRREPVPVREAELDEPVDAWSDELLPELVTAVQGGRLTAAIGRLSERLLELAARGVVAFRFHDVAALLTRAVRRRWIAVWSQAAGETAFESDDGLSKLVAVVLPDSGVEEREAFEALTLCVGEALPELGKTKKTRGHLERLWTFLRVQATEGSDGGRRNFSDRRIAELLDIPRQRLPELYTHLGHQLVECREPRSARRAS